MEKQKKKIECITLYQLQESLKISDRTHLELENLNEVNHFHPGLSILFEQYSTNSNLALIKNKI